MELFFFSVEPEKGLAEGEAQVQIGRMMPLIQVPVIDLKNFRSLNSYLFTCCQKGYLF